MNLQSLQSLVVQEYDRRCLKSRVRYYELSKVQNFLRLKYGNNTDSFSKGKDILKQEYEDATGKKLNSAASSAFNELFNQFALNGEESNVAEIKSSIALPSKGERDEIYVVNLCDEVLGLKALRQYRFPFLLGDTGKALPVDAYYQEKNLVVEYCERQHTEAVPFFDKRKTVSGVIRGEQRKIYDDCRREILSKHHIELVNISYFDFEYDSRKIIIRNHSHDMEVVKTKLKIADE